MTQPVEQFAHPLLGATYGSGTANARHVVPKAGVSVNASALALALAYRQVAACRRHRQTLRVGKACALRLRNAKGKV